ncbi:hypothetical protein EDB19DRAFT_1713227 [Suillus lakei]|nr:hypothetical protein EDB19DRAFT_1713227 [Suillus lakei]
MRKLRMMSNVVVARAVSWLLLTSQLKAFIVDYSCACRHRFFLLAEVSREPLRHSIIRQYLRSLPRLCIPRAIMMAK